MSRSRSRVRVITALLSRNQPDAKTTRLRVMTRVLALSSQVAFGHVGLSAAAPVLHCLGHDLTPLPTVLLSNHPSWPHVAGAQVPVDQLRATIDALEANGWLTSHDALLTGYLPSAAHVALAAELIDRLRAQVPGIRVIVDPVLGDAPKGLYINEAAAAAVRDLLIGRADVLTPNRFELEWLTGMEVGTVEQMKRAAETLDTIVYATSAPIDPETTGVLCTSDEPALCHPATLHDNVPNGVGDVFSALVSTGLPVAAAMGHLQSLIASSLGADHLNIIASAPVWTRAAPIAGHAV